jgi:hypothetical protein
MKPCDWSMDYQRRFCFTHSIPCEAVEYSGRGGRGGSYRGKGRLWRTPLRTRTCPAIFAATSIHVCLHGGRSPLALPSNPQPPPRATMATKSRGRKAQQVPQMTDYETDYAEMPASTLRTNDELNMAVLARHYPSITTILSIAPYAVLYTFSPSTQAWEKSGIEGTLFVCAQHHDALGAEHFSVVILNRRGLENFEAELRSSDDIEVTDEYVILKGEGDEGPIIYGLWIFAEPPPSSTSDCRIVNAAVIQECANRAESSRALAQEAQTKREQREREAEDQGTPGGYVAEESEQEEAGVPMGRQLSLRELFGKQREQDSGFSVHNHDRLDHAEQQYTAPEAGQALPHQLQQQQQQPPQQVPTPQFITHPDTDFFRSGPRFATPQTQNDSATDTPVNGGGALLEDMFRKARQGQNEMG